MDNITSELFIDLESGRLTTEEGTSQSVVSGNRKEKNLVLSIASGLLHFNGAVGGDNRVNAYGNLGEPSKVAVENVEVVISNRSGGEENEEHMALLEEKVKEKHKKRNYRKASKPPRPPKGPSLDVADLKLVKEISAINMKKRARSEHLKAMKKMKETKSLSSSLSSSSPSSSSPSSLSSSLSAMVITVLFFLVILYQGFYSGGSPSVSFQGSPEPALATNSLISVQFYDNPSPNGSGLGS
ncbi:uncharacterized protein LOC131331281 isoform X2 [Rhododendron vialii]|uniref:uncharacterized protein LOC131331281 isoform X2 n=1 Tax=Rhododendron vialii TaxID=182163 RepID=UPI00265E8852|nr:uncharacterized protein LOC131331281 isoform X2 [Rhododendron vialii]